MPIHEVNCLQRKHATLWSSICENHSRNTPLSFPSKLIPHLTSILSHGDFIANYLSLIDVPNERGARFPFFVGHATYDMGK